MSTNRSVLPRPARWLAILLAASLIPVAAGAEERDPRAVELARGVLEAMGGEEAWAATRFLRFEFFGRRLHHWDRHSGRHRVEGEDRDGNAYVVLHNVQTREGTVTVNGEGVTGEDAAKWLENAYGMWVNDTYWLLMPYKMLDPGVNLAYDGEEEIDGKTYDKLKLTFEGVGLTPGDTYWAYVDRESHLMERWAFFLESWEEDREPAHFQWLDWDRYGRVLLSPRRLNPADGSERLLGELAVFDDLPDSVFSSPAPVALE